MTSSYTIAAVILYLIIPAYLFSRILPKAGYPRWWALAALLPPFNVIALWLLAFSDWPSRPALPPPGPTTD